MSVNIMVAFDEEIFPLTLTASSKIKEIISILQSLFGPGGVANKKLLFNGQFLDEEKTIQQYGIQENDVVQFIPYSPPSPQPQQQPAPARGVGNAGGSTLESIFMNTIASIQQNQPAAQAGRGITPELFQQAIQQVSTHHHTEAQQFRDHMMNHPYQLQALKRQFPELGDAIVSGNLEKVTQELTKYKQFVAEQTRKRNEEIEHLNQNPFDVEAQRKIEEEIRMEGVNENRMQAMEYNPEAFGSVVMLYIDCKVNNTPVKAFIDSGAQITLMSAATAERCGIMRFIDRSYAQNLVGVGTCRALGRVHIANILIGNTAYSSSFTIVADSSMDFLIGLDMLRKHRCVIDLVKNTLRIGDGEEEVPFLSEKDIPKRLLDSEVPQLSQSGNSIPTSPQPVPSATQYPEAVINNLMNMGNFQRQEVISVLESCGGDENLAASLLLQIASQNE